MSIDYTLLALFIPTFMLVSATPGMCMTLSLTLGMSIGLRKTFWMMWGELLGVAIVSVLAVLGIANVMLHYPQVFNVLKYAGGGYLIYLGVQMWRSKGKMAISSNGEQQNALSRGQLAFQGLFTAIANPKGWAFMISLLPPFINPNLPMAPQLSLLVAIILVTEFSFLVLYASGGKTLRRIIGDREHLRHLNQISGTLMAAVGVWLALG